MAREFQDNPALFKELAEDEKIVWKGAPETFPLMTEENKGGLTKRWLGCIVVAVALIVGMLVMLLGTERGGNPWVFIIVLLGVIWYACMPMLDRGKIMKKCKYYITDRRVILESDGRDYFSIPLAGVKSEIIPAEEGCVHVNLGCCQGIVGKKRRVAAFTPKKDENDNICGFVIYNVADSAELRAIFNK